MQKRNRYQSSRSAMGKQPLKRFTIAITGYFGEQRSSEQMRKWIHNNGGIFAYNVSPKITHLVCSKEDFKKNVAMVQKARQLRTVKIVSWDWLEDTLMKEHPMKESEYLMAPLVKCAADNKEKKKAARKENIRKGNGYHIYQDCTKFNYDVTLARTNLLVNKNDRFALKVCYPSSPTYTPPHKRHLTPDPMITTPIFPIIPLSPRARARIHCPRAQRLQLFESHATPKYYACYAKYSSPGHAPTSEMLAPIGSPWETAWDAFQGFFELKTGKKWEERFVRMALGSEAFTYTPPKVGQPRGMFLEI
ncbi:hypothetical protein HO133_002146 [Letharia lupina]|uniref:BRCT domain-containing protein n=1 Tax=Letharia lupina TaxID=560253 RepID=A0A8H6CDQ5_9LECA|nr:uncharacterized protein HO133_002146 [Letharia lupina]KAF6221291.1 hypothetical protein HO133_002146 [Letharia lupina]